MAYSYKQGPRLCLHCGAPLAGDDLAGNCPRCLANELLSPDAPEPGRHEGNTNPPSVAYQSFTNRGACCVSLVDPGAPAQLDHDGCWAPSLQKVLEWFESLRQ